ncbi:RNA-binding protein 34-like isoform X2 [Bradysia coprophila]|uniref:RNA-binding protein 34-like isoform X2 n=1 Tax=Bradysia coprophila TaxID=38358 RepID=UPI00187DD554|nr:RNA-binding protein 34-like isoform X2 [Bradysia coprophila]
MAKIKKSANVQKNKENAVAAAGLTNKSKNKLAVVPMKKQKNKKNKKAGDENSAMRDQTVPQSNGQSTKNSSPGKKAKNVIVDDLLTNEVLSNPKVTKKASKKQIVKTVQESTSPDKINKKKVAGRKDEGEVIEETQTKSDKKRKNSTTVDEENQAKVEPKLNKKRNKPKAAVEKEQENNESPKKQKSKKINSETENEVGPAAGKKRKKPKTIRENEQEIDGSPLKQSGESDDETDNEGEGDPTASKKRKKSKTAEEDEQETDESPKKKKSKKSSDETTEEAAEDKTPSISVFVGNLPLNTKRGKLLKLFSKFGKVKSIRFRLSNGVKFFKSQSKVTSPNVIAFVDFESEEDATSSLVLNGEKIKDNVIRVNMQSKAKSTDSFDGKRTVFVGNLKYSVTDQNLHDLFSCCGDIEYARTMQCDKGCNGVAYVCFKKSESISMALELNNADLQGRPVRVERYVKKTPGGPKEKKDKQKPTGAVRRLGKKQKPNGLGKGKESNAKKTFTGVKAKDKKKSFVKKGKKPLKGPKLLAKTIASRDKTTKTTS